MKDIENSCKIALVQAEPVMFDKSASLKKALQWIAEAAAQKPDLIVFPELFIPGYPVRLLHRETKRGWTERLETLLRCLCRCRRNRVSASSLYYDLPFIIRCKKRQEFLVMVMGKIRIVIYDHDCTAFSGIRLPGIHSI